VGTGTLAALAGCGRAIRPNDVSGGIKFVNDRADEEAVTLRAFRLTDRTPDDTTPTAVDREPVASGLFRVPGRASVTNDSFFTEAGTYLVAASNRDATARARIKLFATLDGGVGSDTVIVRLPEVDDVRIRVTDVD
jgi:hypothetical protein